MIEFHINKLFIKVISHNIYFLYFQMGIKIVVNTFKVKCEIVLIN